jgi:hypothetical protein
MLSPIHNHVVDAELNHTNQNNLHDHNASALEADRGQNLVP